MKLLAFAASLRKGSLNKKLVNEAAAIARAKGEEVDLADLRDFAIPPYDGDVESSTGLPDGVKALVAKIVAADGLLIATPEYNFGMSGVYKNTVDWASRARPIPFRGKSCLLLATSPGVTGGARGLLQARVPLEACGAVVNPDMFSLPKGGEAFDEAGSFVDPKVRERLEKMVEGYLAIARRLAGR